jgi:diacylglycerol kinase family enzyme
VQKIAIIINNHSGSGVGRKALYKALEGHKNEIKTYPLNQNESTLKTVRMAWDNGARCIVAAGGDGTVSAVASAILDLGIEAKLGVIPIGTLNHFARDLAIPVNSKKALEVVLKGKSHYIDAVRCNNFYFINNSSLGLYPFIVKTRDTIKKRGHRKITSMFGATYAALRRHPKISVEFESGGKKFVRKTPFVFIGNNAYDHKTLVNRKKINEGKLSVFVANDVSRLGLVRLSWHALRGKLIEQRDFDAIGLTSLTIRSGKRRVNVAHDGEVTKMKSPIHYEIIPKALRVIIP